MHLHVQALLHNVELDELAVSLIVVFDCVDLAEVEAVDIADVAEPILHKTNVGVFNCSFHCPTVVVAFEVSNKDCSR